MFARLLVLATVLMPLAQDAVTYGGTRFTLPAGWFKTERINMLVVSPRDSKMGLGAAAVVYPARALGGQTHIVWFQAQVKKNLGEDASVLKSGTVKSGKRAGASTLTLSRSIKDAEGQPRVQLFYSVASNGKAALLMAVCTNEKAVDKYRPALDRIFSSLTITASGR